MWYHAFGLSAPELYFKAFIDVLRPDPVTQAYKLEQLVLGPDYPGAATATNSSKVVAQLIGSLNPTKDSPILAGHDPALISSSIHDR